MCGKKPLTSVLGKGSLQLEQSNYGMPIRGKNGRYYRNIKKRAGYLSNK